VYALRLGIAGSAWATVIAQAAVAVAFLVAVAPVGARHWRPDPKALRALTGTGGQILVRTASLYAAFLLAGALLARVGSSSLAAHQVVFQLWMFLALALDALAIAAQVLVSQQLGAGHVQRARDLAVRVLVWSTLTGALLALATLALSGVLPRAFTDNAAVLARISSIWPIFALMQPLNSAVFALDGILIGAGDTRYLMRAMLASSALGFVPLALVSHALGWGIVGVWLAIVAFLLARLLTCAARFLGGRWVAGGLDLRSSRSVDRASPYTGLHLSDWLERTNELLSAYPVSREEVVEIVLAEWDSIFVSRIGRQKLRIGQDLFPSAQIIGYLMHELVAHAFQAKYPDVWRRDAAGDEKDLVNVVDNYFSTEIKASSHPNRLFGNRSYAQPGTVSRKLKTGFFLTVNFERWRDIAPSRLPRVRIIRLGWLDHTDWIGQRAASGQQARINRDAYGRKLIEIYRY
jgi:hypothetical protein